jgi:nucleoside 2-deoxyribosyltransferase
MNMRTPLVYLAGAIAGMQYDGATDWRFQASNLLRTRGVETLNPMRAKSVLGGGDGAARIGTDFHDYERFGAFFTSKGIMTRDFNDVKRCDAMLVNLLGLSKPSLGTVMELGWAFALQKPAIVAIEASGNPHDNHPMIHEAMPFRVTTLDEAIDAVATLLNR